MTQKQMTPEKVIPQEIRERVFALYWGQKVVSYDNSKILPMKVSSCTISYSSFYLLLKPLSSITDEDAVEVAKIRFHPEKYEQFDVLVTKIEGYTRVRVVTERFHGSIYVPHDAADIEKGVTEMGESVLPICDFLRSKGYALPYLNWPVEELVEAGVYKLQNS